jgi:hypothetical protein
VGSVGSVGSVGCGKVRLVTDGLPSAIVCYDLDVISANLP